MWRLCLQGSICISLLICFVMNVKESVVKFMDSKTSLSNTIVKEADLKMPLVTFCPGIRANKLAFREKIIEDGWQLFTYFDVYNSVSASSEDIRSWWKSINYQFEDVFISAKLAYSDKSKHMPSSTLAEVNAEGSGLKVEQMDAGFGTCFTFQAVEKTKNSVPLTIKLNMTHFQTMGAFIHESYEQTGLYLNYWSRSVHNIEIPRQRSVDYPLEMKVTTTRDTKDHPCDGNPIAAYSKCVYDAAVKRYQDWSGSNCSRECSIPQGQFLATEDHSFPLCTNKADSRCAVNHLYQDVILNLAQSQAECRRNCHQNQYSFSPRIDPIINGQPNVSTVYFFWLSTEYSHSLEYLIHDFNSIVASVGGSLGLFLGFSCRGVLDHIIDWIWGRNMTEWIRSLNTKKV